MDDIARAFSLYQRDGPVLEHRAISETRLRAMKIRIRIELDRTTLAALLAALAAWFRLTR
jgi:hypothetical protein